MPSDPIKRIAILTGGGDCPGLNAVIRAIAKAAQNEHNIEIIGVDDSYWGLISEDFHVLRNSDVSGILNRGGTILGTSRLDPFKEAHRRGWISSPKEDWSYVMGVLRRHGIDALVAIGGDGTLRVAARAAEAGIPVVGVPKTIDNDIGGTEITFGFNSAVAIVMGALDNLHTTASSHHRVIVVEVMGRTVGWLALYGGVAGGGDVVLIPEIPYRSQSVYKRVLERDREGKRFSLVVAAEGACAIDGEAQYTGIDDGSGRKVLGGIGQILAADIEKGTGLETRVTTLGHLQRGGTPTAFDRILATRFGYAALNLIIEGRFGQMVALKNDRMASVPLKEATAETKAIPLDHPLISCARSLGTHFGDE